jgi:hypothetical protein
MLKKKIWANFQRIIELFTQKIVTKLSKIWVWDPRSGIRKKTHSGSVILVFTSKTLQNSALVLKKTSYLCLYYYSFFGGM